jgi:hypothetical protein
MTTRYRTQRQRLLAAWQLDVTAIGPRDGVTVLVGPTHPEARPISLMRNGLITASSLGKRPRFWMIFRTAGGLLAADQSQDLSQASTDSLGRRSWLVIVCSVELGGGVIAVPHSRRNSP